MEHEQSDAISVEGSFALVCTSYVSLKGNWSWGDINCLGWDVAGVMIQNVDLDDARECRSVITVMMRPVNMCSNISGHNWCPLYGISALV